MEFRKKWKNFVSSKPHWQSVDSISSWDNYIGKYQNTALPWFLRYINFLIYWETGKKKFCKEFSLFHSFGNWSFFLGSTFLMKCQSSVGLTKVNFVSQMYSLYTRAMQTICRVYFVPYHGFVMVNFKAYLSLFYIRWFPSLTVMVYQPIMKYGPLKLSPSQCTRRE